jgi:hypothetical protein
MKSKITKELFLPAFAIVGFVVLSISCFAQQKTDEQAKSKQTITIHVTKEIDGKKIVIDTTLVTDENFDVDAFLDEKGIRNDMPEEFGNMKKDIIIRHPGFHQFNLNEMDSNKPDTIEFDDNSEMDFSDKFDLPVPPHPNMPFNFNFNNPREFSHFDNPEMGNRLEDLARSLGLGNVMPFGEMKQVVVKKKRNGKKVIITFEDREDQDFERDYSNHEKNGENHRRNGSRYDENIIIYKNGKRIPSPQNDEQVILEGKPGERIIIQKDVKRRNKGDKVIINSEDDKSFPENQQKKIIIIRKEKEE